MSSQYITNIYQAVYSGALWPQPARQNMEQVQRPTEPIVQRYISPKLEITSPRPTRPKLALGFDTNGDHVPGTCEFDRSGQRTLFSDWSKRHSEMNNTRNENRPYDIASHRSPQTAIRHGQPSQYTAQRESHQTSRPNLPPPIDSDNRARNFVYETTGERLKRMLERNNHTFLQPTRVGPAPPPGLAPPSGLLGPYNYAHQAVHKSRATHNACIPEALRTQPATQAYYEPYANHSAGEQVHQQFSQQSAHQYEHLQADHTQTSLRKLQAQPSSAYAYGYQYPQGKLHSAWAPQQQYRQARAQFVAQPQYQQTKQLSQQGQQQSQQKNIARQGARHLRLPSPPRTHNTASRFVGRSSPELRLEAYKINATTIWEEQQERRLGVLPISVPKREWRSPIQAKQDVLARRKFTGYACGIVFDEQMDDNLNCSVLKLGEALIPIKEGEDWRLKTESKHVERDWNGERVFWSREDYDGDGLVWYLGKKTFEIEESKRSDEELIERARFDKWKKERDELEEVACKQSRTSYDEWRRNDLECWEEVMELERRQARRQQREQMETERAEQDAYNREQERQRIEREDEESRERDARRRQISEEAIRKLDERRDERQQRREAAWREIEHRYFDEPTTENVERRERSEAASRGKERQYFAEQATKDTERRRRCEEAIQELEERHRDEEAIKDMERRQQSEEVTRQAEHLRWSGELGIEATENFSVAMSKKKRKRSMSRRRKPLSINDDDCRIHRRVDTKSYHSANSIPSGSESPTDTEEGRTPKRIGRKGSRSRKGKRSVQERLDRTDGEDRSTVGMAEKPESRRRKRSRPSKRIEKNLSKGRALNKECAHREQTVICY